MDKKVNRNTHPILVEAREKSYWAGHRDGYAKGFADGQEKGLRIASLPYEAQIDCLKTQINGLKTIIAGLEEKNRGDT